MGALWPWGQVVAVIGGGGSIGGELMGVLLEEKDLAARVTCPESALHVCYKGVYATWTRPGR
jgi:hypothetical protein